MGLFEQGKVINTKEGTKEGLPITIKSCLGEGTQGYVYEVIYAGKRKALKWYKTDALKDPVSFYKNLEKNVKRGSPNKSFLWPEAITEKTEGSFGYIMDIIPDGYIEFSEYLVSDGGCGFTTYKAAVEVGIRIISAFRSIYNIGYSYQDISSGNFFIKPKTGDVLICDNDNVAPNGTFTGIIGTPQYMAPEIVMGKSKPNTHTDEFSLAVALFMILCKGHPLEGEHWCVSCLTPEKEEKLYGSLATFIFDPDDASNRPVKGVHDYVIKMWEALPQYVKEAFISAFSQDAIKNPDRRVTYLEWLKIFARFQSDIVRCRSCGGEIFIQNLTDTECGDCGTIYEVKNTFKLYEYSVTAAKNTRIYRCQVGLCNADQALDPIGFVVCKNNNPNILELKNMTDNVIIGITPSGKTNQVVPGDIVPIKSGIQLKVFDGTIEIQ